MIDFQTSPDRYRHWQFKIEGRVATLAMDVALDQGLAPGYELKLNSYDLGVDIELYDAMQRLRFEHPEVAAVIVTSARSDIFCSGANIRMLAQSSHQHKVNFCKFTNETRNSIEDASAHSGQTYLCALNSTASGGGYELAEATDYILLADDGNSAVSLPEVPLLAVLPGTGGLTRLIDKRKVRRDHADVFCTLAEGVKGKRALQWRLVDELVPKSKLMHVALERAMGYVRRSDRPAPGQGVNLDPLVRAFSEDRITYEHIVVQFDRDNACAHLTILGPTAPLPAEPHAIAEAGTTFWPLALARELDDLILHLRTNELAVGTWVFHTRGQADLVAAADQILVAHAEHWLVREIVLYLKRTLKRLDVTSRSLIALVEPGSCYVGTLFELMLAADRSYMLDGTFDDEPEASVRLTAMNFGPLPMCNGLTRLQSRFLGDPQQVSDLHERAREDLDAAAAEEAGLVTFIPDDIDWDDEVRLAIEERASFSPDAMTGMEANLRFGGPETLESKIFARLSAWQNWIFQRPNAVGEEGALRVFGTGRKSNYDTTRV